MFNKVEKWNNSNLKWNVNAYKDSYNLFYKALISFINKGGSSILWKNMSLYPKEVNV